MQFSRRGPKQDGALVVAPDALFLDRRAKIADLATRYTDPDNV